ncbi:hypothetical protein PVAND_013271 [Polypedilum vanderplanki]|uniref:Thioredoxin domain-containing protein n=1 Tax=Polypedilum vanderplanki TaxID=319348 RepID=A0A9J6CP05_POLVA|nr:hypothetical protein PVAND_013271 [Polypedilum vanderplanki]
MFKTFYLLVIFLAVVQGQIIQNDLINLTPENFDQIAENGNIFVVFFNNFENYKKFIEMLKEITQVSTTADDEESRKLKFGIFDCNESSLICNNLGISQNVEFKFYGTINKWPALTAFLTQIIEEILQEDELISLLDKPGRLLVLYKIITCPFCHDTLEEWQHVKKYFSNNDKIKVFTVDCTRRRPICKKFGIKKYPKIKFIYNSIDNHQTVFPYEGDRSYKDIEKFANQHIHATMN